MPTYHQARKPGAWIQPTMRGHRIACCFCGLTHRVNFRVGVDKEGREQVQYQMFRDIKATKALRKRIEAK